MSQKYHDKYLKYKTKYLLLKQQIGEGSPVDAVNVRYDATKNDCDTKYANKMPPNYNRSECSLCPFTNSGSNKEPNKCQPFDNVAEYCFESGRLNKQLYLEGKSKIVVENNIEYIEPDGEVCFGNAITSCTTYCFVFSDNSKICAHINPVTTIFSKIGFEPPEVLNHEIVNFENIFDKVKEIIQEKRIEHKITKIIILSAMTLISAKMKVNNTLVLGDESIRDANSLYKGYTQITQKNRDTLVRTILNSHLKNHLNENYSLAVYTNTEIKGNKNIYIIRSDGTPYFT